MLEEGKLAAMLEGLKLGIRAKEDGQKKKKKPTKEKSTQKEESNKEHQHNPVETVAHNLVNYINMKGAGHHRYGTGFFVCTVITKYTNIQLTTRNLLYS